MRRKPNLPPGAEYLGNGPESTLFLWRGHTYRFVQGSRGGTILHAHPCVRGLVAEAGRRRRGKRDAARRAQLIRFANSPAVS